MTNPFGWSFGASFYRRKYSVLNSLVLYTQIKIQDIYNGLTINGSHNNTFN